MITAYSVSVLPVKKFESSFRRLILTAACNLLVLISFPPAHASPDHRLTACEQCFGTRQQGLILQLQKVENDLALYRWTEAKIRRLYYDRLWKVRSDQLDPLDQAVRNAGREEETHLLEMLRSYDKKSLRLSNRIEKSLREMQNSAEKFSSCHPESAYSVCMSKAFTVFAEKIEVLADDWSHLFESERDERQAVALTAGKQNGLYPQDALEKPAEHEDYYSRFEMDHEARRFEENTRFIQSVESLRDLLQIRFEGEACCRKCENTDLLKEIDQ